MQISTSVSAMLNTGIPRTQSGDSKCPEAGKTRLGPCPDGDLVRDGLALLPQEGNYYPLDS
jgi:hypothetical protein